MDEEAGVNFRTRAGPDSGLRASRSRSAAFGPFRRGGAEVLAIRLRVA